MVEIVHLVIDQSGSMSSISASAYAGAAEVIQDMPEDGQVSISTFNKKVTIGELASRDQALAELSSRAASGTTALYDAVATLLSRYNDVATYLFVTDGCDTASTATEEAAAAAVASARARGCRVIFLGTPSTLRTAERLGIDAGQVLAFGETPAELRAGMEAVARSNARTRSGADPAFTALERQRSCSLRETGRETAVGYSETRPPPIRRSPTCHPSFASPAASTATSTSASAQN